MQVLCSDRHDGKHFWGSCSRTWHRNAQATEQQHGDTSSDITLSHYLYMLHLCYVHCISSIHSMLPAFPALSGCLRKCDVMCTILWTEEWWAHTETYPLNPHAMQPFPLVLLEDNPPNTLEILSHAPLNSRKPLTSVFISLMSTSMLLSKRADFLLIDEITWACCPWGSRFGRLPLATSSCNSGRKPGLDLQREIIECVFIHDQSFIQKVLGHLDRKDKRGEIL